MARSKRPGVRRPAGLAARFGLVRAKPGAKKLGKKVSGSRVGRGSKAVGRGVKAIGRAIRDFGRGAMGPRVTAKRPPRGKRGKAAAPSRRGAVGRQVASSKRPPVAKKATATRKSPVGRRPVAAAKKAAPARRRSVGKSRGRRSVGRRGFNSSAHPRHSNGRFRSK